MFNSPSDQDHLEPQQPIKLISQCFVKPKNEIEAEKQAYHLGPGELVFLSIDPIQKGLLFTLNHIDSNNRTKIVSNLLDKLKYSLSIALVHFYPLAGRFVTQKYDEENTSSILIDCNKGPGARFIHATSTCLTVEDVLSPIDVTITHPFFDLGERSVNYDGHTNALLSIQVTELLDGVFIGFSISHSVVDGTSFVHFVSMLSEIFLSDDHTSESNVLLISRMPILNYRPWLNSNDAPILKFPSLDMEGLINRGFNPGPLRERIFQFSLSSMKMLKIKANQECGTDNVISSFLALTALVWRSITKARNLPSSQQTICFLAIGARGRVDPPVSDDHFGNIITKDAWGCTVEELLGHGVGWAAMNLRKLVAAQNGKVILDFYKEMAKSPMMIPRGLEQNPLAETGVVMGGSARFDLYGAEFGLGRALAIRMGYANKEDGKITASAGCEGGGSVDLEVCLKPHVMATLESDHEFMHFVSSN